MVFQTNPKGIKCTHSTIVAPMGITKMLENVTLKSASSSDTDVHWFRNFHQDEALTKLLSAFEVVCNHLNFLIDNAEYHKAGLQSSQQFL